MDKRGDLGAALGVTAAVAGTGYASGRELVLFFAQLGWAGWMGIPFASAVFALLVALLCRWARRAGADSLAELCQRGLGPRAAALAAGLHLLLMTLTAGMMLCGAGEIGALVLPLSHSFLWGAALALLIALGLNLGGLRGLPLLGVGVLLAGLGFYGGLAIDARPVRVYLSGVVQLALEGSVPAALLLALTYGAMNACLGAGAAVSLGRGARPGRVGALCGGMLCALLLCANGAVARGGRQLLAQALPSVILSARWGATGFWLCSGFGFLCATATLAAALGGMIDHLRHIRNRRRAWALASAAALACLSLGLGRVMDAVYPAVGWLCAALLLALVCRGERASESGKI